MSGEMNQRYFVSYRLVGNYMTEIFSVILLSISSAIFLSILVVVTDTNLY